MEQLSSCYFCGAALDSQIEPYRVVPPTLEPDADEQRAVSLCPTCRRKLSHVVETVVGAVDGDASATAGDEVAAVEPEGSLLGDDARGSDGPETVAEAPTEQAGAESVDWVTPDESDEASDADEQSGGDPTREQSGSSSDPLSTGDGADDPADAGAEESSGTTDESGAGDSYSAGDRAEAEDGPSLTALEYNKVMRLLQNREFPVDRAEIHEVATSAYDVSDEEFDAIIEAAIDRGLIGEENGRLVSGD